MSDEYRRVLHEWAARFVPSDGTVTSVDITYDDGYDPTFTGHEPSLDATVYWRDSFGRTRLSELDPTDVGTLGEVLTALFAIADAG